jgi:hypothetical protein
VANEENLKPWKKGQSGNPKGRPKGTKNWSTIVQRILADEELMDKISKNKPSYWSELPEKNAANAIIVAMVVEALKGNHKAADWLRKTGYGEKLKLDAEEGLFQATKIEVEIVRPNPEIEDVGDAES